MVKIWLNVTQKVRRQSTDRVITPLTVETMASALPFSTIVMAGHMHSRGFPGNIGQTCFSLRSVLTSWSKFSHSRPILGACVQPQECAGGGGMRLKNSATSSGRPGRK